MFHTGGSIEPVYIHPKDDGRSTGIVASFNIELLRAVGLFSMLFILLLGTLLTTYVTNWPDPSKPFDFTATYIYKLFGFNHSCTMIDFNPSKTISAVLTVAFNIIPLTAFVVMNFFRMQHDYERGRISRSLAVFNKMVTPVIACFLILFVMVFVNSPVDRESFILHYFPYFLWQMAMILMSIQQIHYLIDREKVPFNIPKWFLIGYYWVMIGFYIFYTIFVWSFIAGAPVVDTSTALGLSFSKFMMFFLMVLILVIPGIFAAIEARDPQIGVVTLEFSTL